MTHRKPLSLTGLADPVLHLFHLTINIFSQRWSSFHKDINIFWQHSFRKDINIFQQRIHSLHIVICKVEALPNPGKHRHQKMKAKQEEILTSSLVVCIKLLLTASSVASIRNLLGFFSTIWIWLGRIRLIYDWSLSPPYFLYCHLALSDHQGWHDWHDFVQPERCPQDPPSPTRYFSASSSALSSPTPALPLVCRYNHGQLVIKIMMTAMIFVDTFRSYKKQPQ